MPICVKNRKKIGKILTESLFTFLPNFGNMWLWQSEAAGVSGRHTRKDGMNHDFDWYRAPY